MAAEHRTFTDAELDALSVRVACDIGEWRFGSDGLVQLPQGLHEQWKSRCWASAVLPDIRPTKLLYVAPDGVQVWQVIDAKGNDVCTVVRYERRTPSHVTTFEKHVELLLMSDSIFIIKFAGAYATDTSICLVLQPLAGSRIMSLVEMRQCGPLPEAFLSLVLRSILKGLQALSSTGHLPETLNANHLWLGSESVKLGTTFHFDWQPSDEARAIRMNDCIASLPEIIYKIAGIPPERLRADDTEELWAPGGFFPDAKYAVLAASMWPLRFGKETDDRVRLFMQACGNPDMTLDDLLNQDLIAAYNHLAMDAVFSWFKVQGEYERFKYARNFTANRIFASSAAKRKEKQKQAEAAKAAEDAKLDEGVSKADGTGVTSGDVPLHKDAKGSPGVGISPEGAAAVGTTETPNGKPGKKEAAVSSPDKKATVEDLASKADELSDEELIKHLYQLFQDSQSQGSDEGLFKGLRGLKSLSEADFSKICQEFHILDRYRGAMTRTLGSPKQLRAKKEPVFYFKKEPVIKVYEPQPMSDTVKKVTKLAIDHWWNNMKGLQGRNKLRTYIQGTIWGRIGKLHSAKAFEEWHVIVMTKKLYDKREELRAIFGRDVVKRIFKCWVDFVFDEVDAPPVPGMTAAELQARPRMLKRRQHHTSEHHGSPDGATRHGSSLSNRHHGHHSAHHDHHGHHSAHHDHHGHHSAHHDHHGDHHGNTSPIVKFPEIPSAVSPQAHSSMQPILSRGGDRHVPSPPAHKRVQHNATPRHFQSPRATSMVHDGSIKHHSDRLLLHEDRGVLAEDYRAEGFFIHQIGLIDVPPELRHMWTTKGLLERSRDGLRLLEMQHRDPSGIEVWSIVNEKGTVVYSAVIYSRSKKEHCDTLHNHLRFLLAEWTTTPELDGAEPLRLLDAYASGKHIYILLEGFQQGNLSLMTRPDRFGPIPEPMMSVAARQMLHALGVLHSHGVSCNGKLKASSFCLLPDGRLKLGALFHFDIPPKKNMEFAISQDLHALLEAVEQLADARSQDAGMLARHEFENKIKMYELKINQLRTEKAQIVKRQGDGGKDKKQQMLDDTRLAVLNTELKTLSDKLEEVRTQIHKADEAMRLFPLTYSSKGRCHDFVAQAARPVLTLGQVYHHPFISSYLDVGAEALVRWVALKGCRDNGNRLASTLYELDPEVQAEIEQASQKPNDSKRRKGSSMEEQQVAELNKIFQSYVVRGTGMDEKQHMDVNGLRRLIENMFPGEGYSNAQIEDGFSLIDLSGSGKIFFDDFCEWWLQMKFTDKLGLRQQWKREIEAQEVRAAGELDDRAMVWRRKNCLRRWRDRYRLITYFKFKGTVIAKKHNFGVLLDHVKGWRTLLFNQDNKGPQYGKSSGARIMAADRDPSRRKWGRHDGPDGEWEHGGALTVDSKKGQFGKASTPGGLISRSTVVTPNPGNFAMRSPRRRQLDPQSKMTHAPKSSPRNQRTNLRGAPHEFTRLSDSKYSSMEATSASTDILSKMQKKSPTSTGVSNAMPF